LHLTFNPASKLSFAILGDFIMASTEPDIEEVKSWEEAFNHPIATTRQIEKQLRNDLATNKERLRTLVG
jgi:conserved oligomeric Golgi complex subunit 1